MSRKQVISIAVAVMVAAIIIPVIDRNSGNSQNAGILAQEKGQVKQIATAADKAVRQASESYVKALNAGDLAGVMMHWADDADYVTDDGEVTQGKEALTARFKAGMEASKGTTFKGQVNSVKMLRAEVAIEDGTLFSTAADGTKGATRYTVIWSKINDKWLISSVRDLPTDEESPSLAYPSLQPLEWMVGEWQSEGEKKITMSCKWAPNKTFLLMDFAIPREGDEPMSIQQRVGWDSYNGIIRSWLFDSAGGFGEAFWGRDGNIWVADTSGITPDGGIGGSTNTWEFVDQNHFTWSAFDREIDGQPLADATVKFVRKTAK